MLFSGNFILQVDPPSRKPVRLTLFGVPESLTWSIADPSLAELSGSGREAVLDFKKDGRTKIVVSSGDVVVFRLGVTVFTGDGVKDKAWQATVWRENEAGQTLDMYGDVYTK